MTCCWLHKPVVWSWGSVNSNALFFSLKFLMCLLSGNPHQKATVGQNYVVLSFWSQADNLNLEIYTCRQQVTVGVTNWICFYCTQFYGSYGLAGVISQFSSWGRTQIKYLWLIHLECGDVSSTFPKWKLAQHSHRIALLLILGQL